MTYLRWDVSGPYDVVFTTRAGGVSDGPFSSLNLGRKTGDDVERVDENRRRACAEIGADAVLERLRYPTRLRRYVVDLVRAHAFWLDDVDGLFARRFLRDHGEALAHDLVDHKEADLRAKDVGEHELEAVVRLRALLEAEASNPHRLSDLAVDGSDLLELG